MKLETKFDLGDKVKIPELQRNGKILAIHFNDYGLWYRVRYFDNSKAEEVYFSEEELEKI